MDSPGQSAACSSSGFRAGCWSASSAAGSSSTRWKACSRRWAFLICGIRKIAQRVEVRDRLDLHRLDDRLELRAEPLMVLLESGVIFVQFLDPTKRLHLCHEFFGLDGVLQPVHEVFEANDQNGIVEVRVKVGLEARGER